MEPLKISLIGAGLIGQRHIDLIKANPACQLAGICDVDLKGHAVAAQVETRFYTDLEHLCQTEQPDGAIIATPTDQHAKVGMVCAKHGVHMLVEKPITASVTEAQQFLNVAERCGVQILVGHHRRHNPLVQRARAVVQNGELGKLVAVSALFTLMKPRDYYQVGWRTQPGGGPVLINLAHDIDNLRYICGEIRSVYAATRSAARGFAVEDTASITLEFENGALGSILVSDAVPSPWSYELTSGENPIYAHSGQDCYYLCGTQASLAFPSMTLWRYADGQEPGWYRPLQRDQLDVEGADPLVAQLAHFCRVIRGEESPLIDGWDGLRTLAATLAVLESARRKTPVDPSVLG